jgi:hypothetical protein
MDAIRFGGRPVAGFALGQGIGDAPVGANPTYAAVMTGAAVGLGAYVLRAPVWGAVVSGALAALLAKTGMDRAA